MAFDIRAFAYRHALGVFGNAPWAAVSREIDGLTQGDVTRMRAEMVRYATRAIPYYGPRAAPRDFLESFTILTKDHIRRNLSELTSIDHAQRGATSNTSGGSTGEPVRLLQDIEFRRWIKPLSWRRAQRGGRSRCVLGIRHKGMDKDSGTELSPIHIQNPRDAEEVA